MMRVPLLTLLLVAVFATVSVSASSGVDLPCLDWSGPSAHHQMYGDHNFECSTDSIVDWIIPRVIGGAILMVVALLTFIACPCVFVGRYVCQCCGSYKQRPDAFCCGGEQWDQVSEEQRKRGYSHGTVTCTKAFTVLLALLGIIALALTFASVNRVKSGIDEVRDGFLGGVNFLQNIVDQVLNAARRINGGSYVDPNVFNELENTIDDIRSNLIADTEDIRTDVKEYSEYVGYAVIAPSMLLISSVLFAVFNIRSCAPGGYACMFFILQFVFLISGSLLLVVHNVVANPICKQMDAQFAREPGVTQWYLLPKCEEKASFQNIRNDINTGELDAISEGCDALSQICSSSSTWSPVFSDRVFQCDLSNCSSSVDAFNTVLQNMPLKVGVPSSFCNVTNCTFEKCADSCTDTDVRNSARQVVDATNTAEKLIAAYREYIEPWLSCNALIDKVLDITLKPTCSFLPHTLAMLAAGFICIGIGCWIGIIIMLRGQKRFFDRKAVDGPWESMKATEPMLNPQATNMNAGVTIQYATPASNYDAEMKPSWEGNFGTTTTSTTVITESPGVVTAQPIHTAQPVAGVQQPPHAEAVQDPLYSPHSPSDDTACEAAPLVPQDQV